MSFICFDTEDNSKELLEAGLSGFDKRVTQIAAITRDDKKYYNEGDTKDFLRWLKQQPEKYIYAHNLQYDLGNLFSDDLSCLDVTMVGGRLIKAVWGAKIFVDSYNIWPMSAKKLGEAFGLAKLETGSMATDKAYVFRDVEIIQRAMAFAWQFADLMDLKNLPPTLGGLCVKVWKHFGGVNTHDSHELSRQALFGGRVELFSICDDETWSNNPPESIYSCFHGKTSLADLLLSNHDTKNIVYTDINSLYPAMMLKEYPGELETWTKKRLPKFGIAKCKVYQPKTDLAVLPYRGQDGRILYPCGTFKGTWTITELNYFKSQGGKILKVYECIGTNECSTPYKDFMLKMYEMRLDSGSDAEKLFFKLLMNNLFGRLGTSGEIGRSVWQTDENKFDGIPYGDKVLVNYKMPLSDETNWCHAAMVTAYGRIELHKKLKLIFADKRIYCDTDCTVFNFQHTGEQAYIADNYGYGYGALPFKISKELGEMKLEGWESIAFAFAPKMYKIGKTYKAKGVPSAKARGFIETSKASFDMPFKLREAMRFFDRANSKRLSVWRNVSKIKQTTYDRKKLVGNKFFPCTLNDV